MPATQTTRSRAGTRPKTVAAAPDASWMTGAACTNRPDLPWIADADSTTDRERVAMAGVCAGCPVQALCATYVAGTDVTGGFWAGKDQLPPLWQSDTAPDTARAFSWVARSSGTHQWEQGALNIGGAA